MIITCFRFIIIYSYTYFDALLLSPGGMADCDDSSDCEGVNIMETELKSCKDGFASVYVGGRDEDDDLLPSMAFTKSFNSTLGL